MKYFKAIRPSTGEFVLLPVKAAYVKYQVSNPNVPKVWSRIMADPESPWFPLVVEKPDGNYRYADDLQEAITDIGDEPTIPEILEEIIAEIQTGRSYFDSRLP